MGQEGVVGLGGGGDSVAGGGGGVLQRSFLSYIKGQKAKKGQEAEGGR